MRNGLDPGLALDRGRHHQRVHACPCGGVVVDVDEADLARVLQRGRDLDQAPVGGAERRVELNRHDPLALAEGAREPGLQLLFAERDDQLALVQLERRAGLPLFVHRGLDRCDLGRGRPAAAADDLRAEVACVGGELAEVLRRGVGVDDAAAREAGEADVREGRERLAVPLHLVERVQGDEQAGAVVGAHRGHVEGGQPLRGLGGVDPGEGLGALVEGHQGHDREARHAPYRLDRVHDLTEVVERLDHEQVGAPAFEDARLLGEELAADAAGGRLPDRPDRAGDEDVPPGRLARLRGPA